MAEWQPFSLTHVTYPTQHSPLAPLLALLSLLPPFGVCALATSAAVYRDVVAAYLLVGSVASTLITSIVKKIVQEPRPPRYDDGGEAEWGMPSNHSCFAWFLAAFVMLYVVRGGGAWAAALPSRTASTVRPKSETKETWEAPAHPLVQRVWHFVHGGFLLGLSLFLAAGCAYSRIYLGYHTPTQVCAGSILGAALGTMWYGLFEAEAVRSMLRAVDARVHALERERMVVLLREAKGTIDGADKRR